MKDICYAPRNGWTMQMLSAVKSARKGNRAKRTLFKLAKDYSQLWIIVDMSSCEIRSLLQPSGVQTS